MSNAVAEATPSLRAIFELTCKSSAIHRKLGIPPSYALDRGLAPYFEAAEPELVTVGANPDGRPVRLLAGAAEAWRRLRHAAENDAVQLIALSGFRSVARQTEIIRKKLSAGQKLDAILRSVAAPGFSEHHTGRALDIGAPGHAELNEDFARTTAFRWLEQHAAEFDFTLSFPPNNPHGIDYEPWHWCWRRSRFNGG